MIGKRLISNSARAHHDEKRRGVGRCGEKRRGVAALEAAVVTPMLLVLVLGTIEMGTALRASTIMQSAVREAGRLASMDWRYIVADDDTPNAKLVRDLRNFVTASGLPGDELTVSVIHADGDDEGENFDLTDPDNNLKLIKIELSLPYSQISLWPNRYLGGSNVNARLIMRAGMGAGLAH